MPFNTVLRFPQPNSYWNHEFSCCIDKIKKYPKERLSENTGNPVMGFLSIGYRLQASRFGSKASSLLILIYTSFVIKSLQKLRSPRLFMYPSRFQKKVVPGEVLK